LFSISNGRLLCCALLLSGAGFSSAQSLPDAPESQSFSAERQLPRDLIADQKAVWTSPLHIHHGDLKWLIPVSVGTAGLIAADRHIASGIGSSYDRLETSKNVSYLGSYGLASAIGTTYAVGLFTHNDRARETGLLSAESVADAAVVQIALKYATSRERPNTRKEEGHFWAGGDSFPSGHAISVWSAASVFAEEYQDKPLVHWGAYGVATAVSLSRITGRDHFTSDVVVGSTLGYLIGHYVYGQHAKEARILREIQRSHRP